MHMPAIRTSDEDLSGVGNPESDGRNVAATVTARAYL